MMSEQTDVTNPPQTQFHSNPSTKMKNDRSTFQNFASGGINIGNLKDKAKIPSPPFLPTSARNESLDQQKKFIKNNFNNIQNSSMQKQQQQTNLKSQFENTRLHNSSISSLSSTSTSSKTEIKAHALQRDLKEMKNSMSEINDLALLGKSNSKNAKKALEDHQILLHTSFEKLIDQNDTGNSSSGATNTPEPLVTFPEDDSVDGECKKLKNDFGNVTTIPQTELGNLTPLGVNWQQKIQNLNLKNNTVVSSSSVLAANNNSSCSSSSNNNNNCSSRNNSSSKMNFEEKRFRTESNTFMSQEGFSSTSCDHAVRNTALAEGSSILLASSDIKNIQGAVELGSNKATNANIRSKYQKKDYRAGQLSSMSTSLSEAAQARTMTTTTTHQHLASTANKIQSNTFSMENLRTISQAEQKQTFSSSTGIKHVASASKSQAKFKITSSSAAGNMIMSSTQFSNQLAIQENHLECLNLEDLGKLCSNSSPKDIDNAIKKYSKQLDLFVKQLQNSDNSQQRKILTLNNINEIIRRAWTVPTFGHKLGYSLCNALRDSGGLDLLMKNCVEGENDVKFSSARLLEQCLTIENRSHVVDNGLEKVVNIACVCTKNSKTDHSRIGTGILEHLFKHSEGTCSDVIRLGGLDAVLFECRRNDTETLRHCAGALANLSLYGGAENQEAMISKKVPMWLFPLAFHDDDTVKYYACLAIAALVANKEIEAEVLKSGTLDLVEPFVTTHNPSEFAKSNLSYAHGQSKHWLQRLVPVLNSNREEARNLAAFHFCMEAGIKKEQGCTEIFNEIGAIEPLKTVASCPNAIASKFAAQALRLIGEQVPHKLSQQVPLWSVEDVQEWVKQIGFEEYANNFCESFVDGDLLLQLNENNLRDDIGINNGIRRKRFLRELQNLMKMADYSSKDAAKIHNFLSLIGPEYCTYTYGMLNAGVDRETLKHLTEDQLIFECNITNSIHRLRILNAFKSQESNLVNASEESLEKTLDVFVSYRRSNGSQLASLLKVHLQLRGFSVFIDVERLEAGKFDNNLLNSIRQAKHFILVLTPEALERCIEDYECKDWVHREIVAALSSNCNIIPIIDNFQWPEPEQLPEDMRSVCHFNGVRWIHDYQDACVDKLERFMRGELSNRIANTSNNPPHFCGDATPSTPGTASTSRNHPPNYQRMHSNDSGKSSDKDINGNNCNVISNNNNINNSPSASNDRSILN